MDAAEVLFLAVIGFSAFNFFSSNYLAFAEGDSMQPTFTNCTLVTVNPSVEARQLRQDDIVVVDISAQQAQFDEIVHRVVENVPSQEKFSTRGDNDSYYDFPSSIDGFFDYGLYKGKVGYYINLPEAICNLKGGE